MRCCSAAYILVSRSQYSTYTIATRLPLFVVERGDADGGLCENIENIESAKCDEIVG